MRQRITTFIVVVSLLLTGIAGLFGQTANAQSVDTFTISKFDADYYLNKDNEGRSTLKTVEKITAVFPSYDQNHGLERALPKTYDGHSTNMNVVSVTDETGVSQPYSDHGDSGDNTVLRIGDADTYVHGEHTYVITYTQRDVTKFFAGTNDDEFYWDVNGTEWGQTMSHVSARTHMSSDLSAQLNNHVSCYVGAQGDNSQCTVDRGGGTDGTVFSAAATGLTPGQTMTLAAGFNPHTFAAYQPSASERFWGMVAAAWVVLAGITSIAAIGAITWMSIVYYKTMHRKKGKGTIVPEYLPPKDTSVLISAHVLKNATADMTAQIIDLAVRHFIKIYQTKDKTLFRPAEYELEIIGSVNGLCAEERRLLGDLFGGEKQVRPGARFAMKNLQKSYTIQKKLTISRKLVKATARGEYGLFERAEKEMRVMKRIAIMALIIGAVTLSPLMIVATIVALSFMYTLWPLTQKGVALRDYLYGLRDYIKVAEADRIKMLQSPEGVEKVGVNVDKDDPKQLVKLYERVLPYAVLFGVEKEWMAQLGAYYDASGEQPGWYAGNGAFNAVIFSSALSSFSSQSSSYSSSSSSGSGGSGDGGFSGGGGGGGGGGGW